MKKADIQALLDKIPDNCDNVFIQYNLRCHEDPTNYRDKKVCTDKLIGLKEHKDSIFGDKYTIVFNATLPFLI